MSTPKGTMTVGELIRHLKVFPESTPIMATWEGVGAPIHKQNISVVDYESVEIIQIDVEEY